MSHDHKSALLQVMVLSGIDKEIYRRTEWSVDVDDNLVRGLGHSAQTVRKFMSYISAER